MDNAITIHMISDSTGGTVASAVGAATSLFDHTYTQISYIFVRTNNDLNDLISQIEKNQKSIIVYTVTDKKIKKYITSISEKLNVKAIDLLEPLTKTLSGIHSEAPKSIPGNQYKVNTAYLERISALDFAMSHDDGTGLDRLLAADVILVGVSRTSKTPTSIYLAYRGIRAANVPLISNQDPPASLIEAIKAKAVVIGLIATPSRLSQIRKHRLNVLDQNDTPDYADLGKIQSEVADARLFFDRHNLPIIDVTRRSIEETAAAISALLKERTR